MIDTLSAERWSLARRVALRFVFAFFVLQLAPKPLDELPHADVFLGWLDELWNELVAWTGARVLQLSAPVVPQPTGSGDTLWNWVQMLDVVGLSLVATIVWSAADRTRANYVRLAELLRAYVRIGLGATMISYGLAKVVPTQFPGPTLDRLSETFGEASPMGILWTFMGASAPYEQFAGALELLGGVLLFQRRTALVGALVSAGVLTNVVALNLCYDVPVKLFSSNLLLMCAWIVWPDARRLFDVFIAHRGTAPSDIGRLFANRKLHFTALALRNVYLVSSLATSLSNGFEYSQQLADAATGNPLRGVWAVEELSLGGVSRPPLASDPDSWRRVIFDSRVMSVQHASDARERYGAQIDPQKRSIALTKRGEAAFHDTLTYERPADDRLELHGTFEGAELLAKLRLEPPRTYPLLSRGFHFVNEFPYNR